MAADAPDKNNGNVHTDHRRRVRQRFLDGGLDGFAQHNILELLLFYSIPQRDTNETAHNLLETFGSLSSVFDADYADLLSVDGIGENSAVLLKLIPQLARKYIEEKNSEDLVFNDMEVFKKYVISQFIGLTNETAMLFCFNNAGKLLNICKISTGTKHTALIEGRTLLEAAFRSNASRVILAHNHPNGVAAPSAADVDLTIRIISLFRNVDIRLEDHIIVAGSDCFCMAGSVKYSKLF